MKTVTLSVLFMLICGSVFAGYDWQSGNSYNTYQSGDSTYLNGFNTNTGTSWNTKYESDGDSSGTDSDGNMWNYNLAAHTYQNYGTGQICVGDGAARTCFGGQ